MPGTKRIKVDAAMFRTAPRASCGESFEGQLQRGSMFSAIAGMESTRQNAFKFIFTGHPGTRYVIEFEATYNSALGAEIVVKNKETGAVVGSPERSVAHAPNQSRLSVEIVPPRPTTYEITAGPMFTEQRVRLPRNVGEDSRYEWVTIDGTSFEVGLSCPEPKK